MFVTDCADINDNVQINLVTAATSTNHGVLDANGDGSYDFWSTQDTYIRATRAGTAVTTANGYLIRANNTISVFVKKGYSLTSIAAGAGTLNYHKTA